MKALKSFLPARIMFSLALFNTLAFFNILNTVKLNGGSLVNLSAHLLTISLYVAFKDFCTRRKVFWSSVRSGLPAELLGLGLQPPHPPPPFPTPHPAPNSPPPSPPHHLIERIKSV